MNFKDIKKTLQTNFLSPIFAIKKILPRMIQNNKGHIVNISNFSSIICGLKMVDNCASKSALSSFHHSLRLEIKSLNK
jgi:short-subunit dehydrogenase